MHSAELNHYQARAQPLDAPHAYGRHSYLHASKSAMLHTTVRFSACFGIHIGMHPGMRGLFVTALDLIEHGISDGAC